MSVQELTNTLWTREVVRFHDTPKGKLIVTSVGSHADAVRNKTKHYLIAQSPVHGINFLINLDSVLINDVTTDNLS